MKLRSQVVAMVLAGVSVASAQAPLASSHSTTRPAVPAQAAATSPATPSKAVVRVNGAVLTDRDLKREMYAIFPYAQQHSGGFPKDMEPQIRKGALDMIVFEELLYQEAKRRNVVIPAAQITKAETALRKQFPTTKAYKDFLSAEMGGSGAALREKIRRSMLIEKMLKTEVTAKAKVTPVEARAYYDKNPKLFDRQESFTIRTISILPPKTSTPDAKKEAKAKITDILRLTKETKTSDEFGRIAEQVSEDDWHVMGGLRQPAEAKQLPPEVVLAARNMKPGDVSNIIQLGDAYVVFRLEAHKLPGKVSFDEVKERLQKEMQQQKTQEIRAALGNKLRSGAKIEIL